MTPAQDANAIERELRRRRSTLAAAWECSDELVLVAAGELIAVPGRGDRTYPFYAHSEYLYLTDSNRPGGVLAFDPEAGWVHFTAPVTADEVLWSGVSPGATEGVDVAELEAWLRARSGRRLAVLGSPLPGTASDASLAADLRDALYAIRRRKDEVELGRMRVAQAATAAGFAAVVPLLEAGMTERWLGIELEAAFLHAGGDRLAYDTIVAGGPNAAVLHFQPTTRPLQDHELVLIDAGAEYRGYASDVTRTYPVGGELSGPQRELHALVRAAGLAAIELCSPGTEFIDVHRAAALVIAAGLVDFGLLRGGAEELVQRGAVSLFFPHGIGHMVGLGVRDAGGRLRGREAERPGAPNLRIDLPLEAGHVVTIEPGIYFVGALLTDSQRRAAHRDVVDGRLAERMLGFGGIRIEDNVLVTEAGPEVLTADIPLL